MLFPVTRTTAVREDANQDGRTILGSSVHTDSLTATAAYVRHTACSRLDRFAGFETANRFRRFCSCVINSSTSWLPTCRAIPAPRVGARQNQQRHALDDVGLAVLKHVQTRPPSATFPTV